MKRTIITTLFTLAMAASSGDAFASTYGEYLLDGSNTAWFLQLSDTHVDSNFLKYYLDNINWAYETGIPVIQPNFVVVTGDLTDSTTSGGIYGQGPRPEEWSQYKSMMNNWGMTPDFYFDVPGNHDAYGDADLSYYVENSVQGRATGGTQQAWRVDLPGGALLFFSAATTANDGKQWPGDNSELTTGELDQISGFLDSNKDAVFRMCFAHHDYADNVKNSANLVYLFNQNGVYYFSHGHEHDLGVRLDSDGVLRFRIDSLGQSSGSNIGLWAVDNRSVTAKVFGAQFSWPAVIVTAPADARIGGDKEIIANPYNPPVPRSCASAPVRALVFDEGTVTSVGFQLDSGGWTAMQKRVSNTHQWRGYFDATKLSPGTHTVTVKATGTGTFQSTNSFDVEDGVPCNLGPEDPDVQQDGGAPDAGAKDGGRLDGAIADAGTDSGAEKDSGNKDSGTTQDSGQDKDGATDGGASADDTGSTVQTDGSSLDAEGAEPPDDTTQQNASGCSCSTVGM